MSYYIELQQDRFLKHLRDRPTSKPKTPKAPQVSKQLEELKFMQEREK